jgi:hypothetical protein
MTSEAAHRLHAEATAAEADSRIAALESQLADAQAAAPVAPMNAQSSIVPHAGTPVSKSPSSEHPPPTTAPPGTGAPNPVSLLPSRLDSTPPLSGSSDSSAAGVRPGSARAAASRTSRDSFERSSVRAPTTASDAEENIAK